MRRVAPSMPVPADMLRHFAVLTLVITAGIAMFANGENQNALAEQIKQREMQNEALRAQRQKATEHTVVVDGLRVAPGTRVENPDVGADSQPPTNLLPPSRSAMDDFATEMRAGTAAPGGAMPGQRDARGMLVPPPAMNMRMGPKPGQPGQKGRAGLPQSAAGHGPPSEQDVNAMIEASARRAGPPSGSAD